MSAKLRWFGLLACCLMAAIPCLAQQKTRRPNLRLLKQPVALKPMLPQGPLSQVPMSDMPANPPHVTYQDGMLSIVANNSSLGDILREVHTRTGAAIDVPANANERVAARLGPAPAQDVLADLLNGSAFNYVMVGAAGDPAKLQKLVLSPKPAAGAGQGGGIQTAYQPPAQAYVPQPTPPPPGFGTGGPVAQQAQGDEESDSEEADDNANEDQEEGDQAQEQAGANGNNGQPNAGPKTPEQILEMLRQQQQAPPGQNQFPRINQNPPQPPQEQPDNNE